MKPLSYILENKEFKFDPEKEFRNRSVGIISACRGHLSPEENEARSASLENDLTSAGLHHVRANGTYIENFGKPNATPVKERSFITMNPTRGNDGGFVFDTLNKLGKKYDQDSVLHKPHNSESADLVGTNETGFPGLGKHEPVGHVSPGDGEFYTELERKFVFKQ